MPFEFKPFKELPEVILVEPRTFGDSRGWFTETYKRTDFEKHGIVGDFRQDNHSRSVGVGVLRGIHFQNDPLAQGKLVRCVRGEIFDVAVDLRRGSPTYLKWVSTKLSEENRHILWVPPGFGHGFCNLAEVCEVVYKTTNEYSPPHDRSIQWNDPDIGVVWPTTSPTLSEKDIKAPLAKASDHTFTWKA